MSADLHHATSWPRNAGNEPASAANTTTDGAALNPEQHDQPGDQ